MARIALERIAHAYRANPSTDDDWALKELDHIWEDGGAYALLGPSGCGKTTLLNVISGLITPTHGRVLFDGVEVTESRTEQRNIAQVFQFPVIYDTMTVYENLAFPLRNRGVPESRIRERITEIAEMLDLAGDLGKRARRLSADAKQKISLGRGLVREDVAAILFDEPLTVIDPHLKWQLRRKLKEIHSTYRLTLVYVTHDQNEALTFAEKVVVMHEGRVLQLGTPQDLFERPQHTFVGHFIGSPGMNFVPCTLAEGAVAVNGTRIPLDAATAAAAAKATGALELGVRPEFLGLSDSPQEGAVAVDIGDVEDFGNFKIVTVRMSGRTLKAKVPEDRGVPTGRGYVVFPAGMTRLYAGGELVA